MRIKVNEEKCTARGCGKPALYEVGSYGGMDMHVENYFCQEHMDAYKKAGHITEVTYIKKIEGKIE